MLTISNVDNIPGNQQEVDILDLFKTETYYKSVVTRCASLYFKDFPQNSQTTSLRNLLKRKTLFEHFQFALSQNKAKP